MRRRLLGPAHWGARAWLPLAVAPIGCAPTVDVVGVYLPGWLVSAVVGVALSYAGVWWLGRQPRLRALGQSGVLFCSMTVSFALLTWWIFFSSL